MSDGLPPLREVIAEHGLRAKKALGQNFLLDLNLTRRIARTAGSLDDHDVLEIGPGPGGLTRALLIEGARRVVAVERDERCIAALADIAARWPGRLEVIAGDAMAMAPVMEPPWRVVANLPYNIGTALLTRWLDAPGWASLTVMMQREVAERIVARPGTKAYGRLSVLAQWRADPGIAFDVSPQAFTPPPKVTSSVIHIRPRPAPLSPAEPDALARVTAAAFGQRRKMLRQSLKSLTPDPLALLERAGIEPTRRADTLEIAEFCAIARAL